MIRLALAATLLIAQAAPVPPAEDSKELKVGSLHGRVIDAKTKESIADVVVIATSSDLKREQTAVTDAHGVFDIPELLPGIYKIDLQRDGYQPLWLNDIEVVAGKAVQRDLEAVPDSAGSQRFVISFSCYMMSQSAVTGRTFSREEMTLVPFGW